MRGLMCDCVLGTLKTGDTIRVHGYGGACNKCGTRVEAKSLTVSYLYTIERSDITIHIMKNRSRFGCPTCGGIFSEIEIYCGGALRVPELEVAKHEVYMAE